MNGSDAAVADDASERGESYERAGDRAEAFERAAPRLRRIVAGLGFCPADADDILQDAFVEACRGPGEYRGPAAAERWLTRVVINRGLLEYRRRGRFRRAAGEILEAARVRRSDGVAGAGLEPARAEEIELVRQALRELDGSSAAVLVLRYFCECDSTEIGEILGLSAATVRGRLSAARLELAERLRRKGVDS